MGSEHLLTYFIERLPHVLAAAANREDNQWD
jgi:hypothetical protein